MAIASEISLSNQDRGNELERRVTAVNKAGLNQPSNTAMGALSDPMIQLVPTPGTATYSRNGGRKMQLTNRTMMLLALVLTAGLSVSGAHGDGFADPALWQTYDYGAAGLDSDPNGYSGAVFDGKHVYFAPYHNGADYHAEVLRYDTSRSFLDSSGWDSHAPAGAAGGYHGANFDDVHGYIYFAPYGGAGENGEVLQYNTQELFKGISSWDTFNVRDVPPNAKGGYIGGAFDGRFVYFAPYASDGNMHGEVLRYDTEAPFTDASSWEVTGQPSAMREHCEGRC